MGQGKVGPYLVNRVALGDCVELGAELPDESVDVLVTSPPYWGQRMSGGMGVEEALKKTEQAWKKIISKREKETVAAIRSQRSAWPTVVG